MVAGPVAYARVPAICPGGTVLCIASGPSLLLSDVEAGRDRVDASIVVNSSYQMAPWATALYAADARWWDWHSGAAGFQGRKYSVSAPATRWAGVDLLKITGEEGLELNPDGLRSGRNGGYQAINLAVHFGAKRILLLGYDMKRGPQGESHWHGDHPVTRPSAFERFIEKFQTLAAPLAAKGVEVINCSRATALRCFPQMSIDEALR